MTNEELTVTVLLTGVVTSGSFVWASASLHNKIVAAKGDPHQCARVTALMMMAILAMCISLALAALVSVN